jgi:hypothetical protein
VRAVFSSGGPLIFEATAETNRLLGSTPIEVYWQLGNRRHRLAPTTREKR